MAIGERSEPGGKTGDRVAVTDVVFDALSNRRRRLVIRVLRESETPIDIGMLSTRIAAHENEIDPDTVSHRQRKSVYTSLHQNHLPKLADAGFVSADRQWVGLSLTERAKMLEAHLGDGAVRRTVDVTHRTQVWSAALASGFCTTGAIALYPGSSPSSVILATGVALCATFACYWFVSDFAI
ncbi:DUF7344 domain-containing protein [Halobellus salinisoli]|uniref:DUF7344 domain-containing protein n=1 Tax=Halobellus salinisoli TaxID=3108500 RepID=UPI00300BA345